MIPPRTRGAFGGNNGHLIIKSAKEQLVDAEQKIARLEAKLKQMEKEAEEGVQTIEQLALQNSGRQVAIMALGIHFQLTPEAMHDIVQPFFDKRLEELQKEVEDIKTNFKAKLAAGEPVNFTAVENPEKKEG
jgi:chromosome segregation ATPase